MREEFVRRADRRRQVLSLSASFGLYILAALVVWLGGYWKSPDLDKLPSPVYISLEGPGAQGSSLPRGPERPEAPPAPATRVESSKPPAAKPPTSSPARPSPARPAEAKPSPAPAAARPEASSAPAVSEKPSPQPGPLPAPAPGAQTAPETPAPAKASPSPAPEAVAETPPEPSLPSLGPISASGPALPNAVYRSSEKGNSSDTTIGAEAGQAGRNLYVPIYLYLPPPLAVDSGLADRVPDTQGVSAKQRRDVFMKHYAKAEGGWRLKATVPLAERAELWLILEDAGYNAAKADFKTTRNLKPVTLRFTITPGGGGKRPKLENLELVSSSGYADIDEAVLYGFRQSSYFNATAETVTGSFTYRFE